MLASRAGRVGGAAVVIAVLATGWLVICRRSTAASPGIAAQAVQAVLDGRAGPVRVLPTRVLPGRDPARDLGTAHPIRIRATAANGRWLIACQARTETDGKPGIAAWVDTDSLGGDRMDPFLFRGGGEGEAIDGYVTHSRDGRWIVVVRDGDLVLIDDARGTQSVLDDAAVRPLEDELVALAAFSDDSQRLIYLRADSDERTLVVRSLVVQRAREIAMPGRVLSVTPEPFSDWARVQYASGALDAELARTRSDARPHTWRTTPHDLRRVLTPAETKAQACDSWMGYHDREGPQGWLAPADGVVVDRPDVLAHVGGLEVVRRADRSIAIGGTPIVPASCDGALVYLSARPLRAIVSCGPVTRGTPLELFGPALHVVLTGSQAWHSSWPTILDSPVLCMKSCFALDDGRPLAVRGSMRDIAGSKILSEEDGQYFVHDTATGQTTRVVGLAGRVRESTGSIVAIGTTIFDLAQARVRGEVAGVPMRVAPDGRALIPNPAHGDPRNEFALGPLRWVAPRPVGR